MAHFSATLQSWRAELSWLREVLAQGGIVINTCDEHGAVLLRTVVQLDGDIAQIVTPDLLAADAVARDAVAEAHLAQVHDRLATPLTRLLVALRAWRKRLAAGAMVLPAGTATWHLGALVLHGVSGKELILRAWPYCAPLLIVPVILPAIRFATRAGLRRLMAGALQ